jgi:hypothetical protein
MVFPLSVSEIGLWLAATTIILLITSEMLYSSPEYSSRITIDRQLLRIIAISCGLAFAFTVIMRMT